MNEENFHEDHQQVPTPEEEQPQGEKKEGSSMRKVIYGLLAVAVLVLVAVGFSQGSNPENEGSSSNEGVQSQGEWKYDMSEIGLPVLHFVPSSFRDGDTSTAFVSGTYAADDGECQIFFWDQLNTSESILSQDTDSNDFYFQFFNALFQCVDPEPESWDVRFANIDAFMLSYDMACENPTLRRFGWPGDSGDTDLSCIPNVFEFMN